MVSTQSGWGFAASTFGLALPFLAVASLVENYLRCWTS